MSPEDFDRLQSLMSSRAGFRLTRDRMKLAEHRLGPVARREGFETVDAMLGSLWAKPVASLANWATARENTPLRKMLEAIAGVDAEGKGRQPVGDQVDPQYMDG